ncbi:hypothetical protein HHK36_009141 [Tetracentron sinense]|nr:hypothetical protein HHK36_009141 [Tetracentron sinense]
MKNHVMIVVRLASGILVQFWCSYSTVPLNVIVTQMGSRCKKALIAESVRESLHSWCKRVKEKSKRDSVHSHTGTARSICSLESTIDERDEIITIESDNLSRSSSTASLNQVPAASAEQEAVFEIYDQPQYDPSFRISDYSFKSTSNRSAQTPANTAEDNAGHEEECKVETLLELFRKT